MWECKIYKVNIKFIYKSKGQNHMNIKEYYEALLIQNPEFRAFVKENEGKSYQQIIEENNLRLEIPEEQQAV